MNIVTSQREYDIALTTLSKNEISLSIVESFIGDCEKLISSDRIETITQQRALWRDVCMSSFDKEGFLDACISAVIFILSNWAESDHFMLNVLTPMEQSIVIDGIYSLINEKEITK